LHQSGKVWKSHLWQERYFSSHLDEMDLWAIMHYERNPVRTKMVRKAERYIWSSAAAHCLNAKAEVEEVVSY
jgi:hypothetical protein